jgi:hypothetical protein
MTARARWTLSASLAEALFLVAAQAAYAEVEIATASPLEAVFPDARANGPAGAVLEAARGEWEPFQIVVRAPAGASSVRAAATPLGADDGATIAAPRLYRVEYLDVRTPSSVEGHAGRWPDALVPDVDAYVSEKRRAFPFAIPAGEARAIWVDCFVPRSARPGLYRGQVAVEADGATTRVPVELLVRGFTLPATSSLPVTFGFDANALARANAHGPLDDAALAALARRYALAALRHRVSLHGGSMDPPPFTASARGRVTLDFRAYDAEVGPFLDGTADPGGPAEGARWSAIDLRVPWRVEGSTLARYVTALVEHLRARGWLDRVFDYTFDEPSDAQLAEARARAEAVHRLAPAIPRLVTRELSRALAGAVEIWCPVVNRVDDKPSEPPATPRAGYARLWWYQSCRSHGCDVVGGDYFTGWPSLVVDAPPIAHRIFEWLTFRYRVGGELYYNTVEAYARGLDPWRDQQLHGGNGDGTLFYPGTPARIGGATPIPVESIRLKLIREGLEDYEYLRLYAERDGEAQAIAVAATIASRTFQWQHDPRRLYAARHEMAVALDGADPSTRARERQLRWPWRSAPTARRGAPGG